MADNFNKSENLKVGLLRRQINAAVGESELSISVVNLLLRDIAREAEELYDSQFNKELKEYKDYLKQQEDAEAASKEQPVEPQEPAVQEATPADETNVVCEQEAPAEPVPAPEEPETPQP